MSGAAFVSLSFSASVLVRAALGFLLREMERDLRRGRVPRRDRDQHRKAMLEVGETIAVLEAAGVPSPEAVAASGFGGSGGEGVH